MRPFQPEGHHGTGKSQACGVIIVLFEPIKGTPQILMIHLDIGKPIARDPADIGEYP